MARGKRVNVGAIKTADKAQSPDWNFGVYQEELMTSRGVKSGIHAVVRTDNHEVVGEYRGVKALSYPSLVETFEGALTDNGHKFTRELFTTGNGARFFGRYTLSTLQVQGENYDASLRLQSSHDGTLIPGFCFEAKRLACLNAMMIMQAVFAMYKKHSENFDLGFIAANIQQAIEAGQGHIVETVGKMAQIGLTNAQAQNIVSNIVRMGAKVGVSERAGYLIHHNWQNPSADEQGMGNTLFRLYNAATRFTRDVEQVGRFELSRRSNLYISGAFDLAARREYDLSRLLAAPEQPLDFNGVTVDMS